MRSRTAAKASATGIIALGVVLFSAVVVTAMSAFGILGGSGYDSLVLDGDAAMTLDATVTVDSAVENAVEMRIGVPTGSFSFGGNSTHSIADDGTLWGWGYNFNGEVGDGSLDATSVPHQIGTDRDWVYVTGGATCYGLKADGTLLSWGSGGNGGLGDGTFGVDRAVPATVGIPGEWESIDGGRYPHALAIKKDGSLWSWGSGTSGQLGTGSSASTGTPVRVGTANDWRSVHVGQYCSFAIKDNGSLWAWGSNSNYQLGLPVFPNVPTQVATGTAFAALASDSGHTIALRADGALMTWGKGSDGALGDGVMSDRMTPTVVATGTTFVSVAMGYENALAVRSDGALFGWGLNTYGQRGDGSSDYWRTTPSQIGSSTAWTSVFACGAESGAYAGSTLYTWGANGMGILGDGGSLARNTPAVIASGWMPYAPQREWVLASTDGTYTVPVTYRSSTGTTAVLMDSIYFDASPPTGTTVFNDNVASVDTTLVPVRSTMTNVIDMKIGTGPWQPYAGSAIHTVTAGDGVKDLTVLYRDEWSRITTVTANILLDTTAPTGTLTVNAGDANTRFRDAVASTTVSADVTAIRMEPPTAWSQVARTSGGAFGIKSDGSLWVKTNVTSLGGDGIATDPSGFRQTGDGAAWRTVASGTEAAYGVRTDGSLWAWGANQYGNLGFDGYYTVPTAMRIGGLNTWTTVTAGAYTAFAQKSDGTLWAWGRNGYYECAQGTDYTSQKLNPVQIRPGSTFKAVAAGKGYTYAAITTTGSVYVWGINFNGEFGNNAKGGSSGTLLQPNGTGAYTDWVSVAVGERTTYAVRGNGDLYAWGQNDYGQVGDGTTTERLVPVLIGTGFKSVSSYGATAYAIKNDGSLWAWGYGWGGALGNGGTVNAKSPVRVGTRNDWAKVVANEYGAHALTTSGEYWAWGYTRALYGDQTALVDRTVPARGDWFSYAPQFKFRMPAGTGTKTIRAVVRDAAGNTGVLTDTIALDTSASAGTLVAAGGANWSTSPTVTIAATVPNATEMTFDTPFTAIAAGGNSMAAVRGDGRVHAMGYNGFGKLGDGTTTNRSVPVTVTGVRDFASVSIGGEHTLALTPDGTLYAWGRNLYGQLGTGGGDSLTPKQVGARGEWAKVSAGANHSMAIKKDGSLWGWGYGGNYAVGDGSTTNWGTPKQISSAGQVYTDVSAGSTYSMGIRNTGYLYVWGYGAAGQLGLGLTTSVSTPTQSTATTNWASVSAGSSHSLALKTDGSLYYWGQNNYYQLGNGSGVTTTTPQLQRVGGWKSVSAGDDFTLGIRQDGSLWAWGRSDKYQTATGSQPYYPRRIDSANDWVAVDAGTSSAIALKADGTVRTWGSNTYGELGTGAALNAHSWTPAQVMPSVWTAFAPSLSMYVEQGGSNTPVSMGFRDVAGNITVLSDSVGFDFAAPVTSASGVSASWVNASAYVSLTATDNGGSGVASTRYRVNGGATATYTAPFWVTAEGTNTIEFWATDNVGLVEATKTVTARIDRTAPGYGTSVPATGWVSSGLVSLTGTDGLSGFQLWQSSIDGAAYTNPTSTVTFTEGIHRWNLFAWDNAGNYSQVPTITVQVDLGKPSSTATGIPVGWSPVDAAISFDATDALSGAAGVRYRVDASAPATFAAPVVIGNGVHQLSWWALDAAGNAEDSHEATVTIDTTPPQSTSDLTGSWSGVPVTFSVVSPDALSGWSHSDYRIDGGADTPFLGPVTFGDEGTHTVEFWGTDQLGNVEQPRSGMIRIDYTAPVTALTGVPEGKRSTAVELVPVVTDSGSGLKRTYYRLNGGQVRPYVDDQSAIVVAKEGTTTVEYWSVDAVGNTESPKSVAVSIDYSEGGGSTSSSTPNAPCISCHGAPSGTQVTVQNFSVTDVDRATACPKCHTPGLTGTHPQHYAGSNCGSVCHQGMMGQSLLSATASRLTPYGAFATTSSAALSSNELHVIHGSYRWAAETTYKNRKCGSCHARAACTACHAGAVSPAHANHSAQGSLRYPARQAETTRVCSGIVGEDQTFDSITVMAAQCGIAECHDSAGLRESEPVMFEDYSHPANGSTPANTVVTTGKWLTQNSGLYTGGKRTYSNTKGSTLTLAFTGTRVAVMGPKLTSGGEAEFLIDGALVGTNSTYSSTTVAFTTLFTSGELTSGPHTITVRVAGVRPAGSTNTGVMVDQFQVWNRLPGPVAPLCTASCHGDRAVAHGYDKVDHVADSSATIEPVSGARCDACHSMDLLTEHERTGSSSRGGSCVTCHASPRKTFATWNQSCQQGGCHTPGTTEQRHSGLPNIHRTVVTNTCTKNCHESTVPAEHAKGAAGRTPVGCVQCHNSPEYDAKVRAIAWDGTCVTCHVGSHAPNSAGTQLCLDCHGASASQIDALAGAGTWNATGGDHGTGYAASAHGEGITGGANGAAASGISCEACHNHNAIGGGAATDLRAMRGDQAQAELCFECHSASGEETATAKPNTWNGRDIRTEFSRFSTHPLATASSVSTTREETVSAFFQTTPMELSADTRFQTSVLSTTGVTLTWESYTNPSQSRRLLFLMPDNFANSNRPFSQYDPALDRWNRWGYDPTDYSFPAAYYGSSGVSVGGRFVWNPGRGFSNRFAYTPSDSGGPDAWTAISDLPFVADYKVCAAVDASRGIVYYAGNNTGGVVYPWRASDDTWLTPFVLKSVANGGVADLNSADLAYSPETNRLYFVRKTWYQQPRVGWVASPSTVTSPALYSEQVFSLTEDLWGDGNNTTALTCFTRGGHDYLGFLTLRSSGYGNAGAWVISGLASGNHQIKALPSYSWWSSSDGWKAAWDGGDYLYSLTENSGPHPGRIRIPDDPANGTWGSWEYLTQQGGAYGVEGGGAMAFMDVNTAPENVIGYRPSGTVAADVSLPAGSTRWGTLDWAGTTPVGTTLKLRVQGWNGSAWVALPGMDSLTARCVDLSAIDAAVYSKLRLTAEMTTVDWSSTPLLRWWSVTSKSTADVNGTVASLTCASCHNSHEVGTGGSTVWDMSRVSDPANTLDSVSDTTAFCLRCHSIGALPSEVSAAIVRPYDVGFRDFGTQTFFSTWQKDEGGLATFASSGHATTSGTKALCETCHDPHGSNSAELTAWTRPASWTTGTPGSRDNTSGAAAEENLCYQCHGNGVVGMLAPGAQDVATPMSQAYRHDQSVSGAHSDTETAADAGMSRHAECVDCHDPHAARSGTRAIGGAPIASPALLGASGLSPKWNGTNWSSPASYTATRLLGRPGDVEAYVCFKCHTSASGRPTQVGSNGTTYTATDLAQEFNPNNASFHNVLGLPSSMKSSFTVDGTTYNWALPTDSLFLKPGWTHDSPVTCSDCHTSGSMGQANGPHGGSVPFMIDPQYSANWRTASLDFREPDGVWPSGQLICTKCHVFNRTQNIAHGTSAILNGALPVHTREYMDSMRCTSCHAGIPHGWKRPRLLAYGSDPAPYRAQSGPYRGQLDAIKLMDHPGGSNGAPQWGSNDCAGCGIWIHNGKGTPAWP